MTDAVRLGRPRRFDQDTERLLLLDAGLRVMRRNGFVDATVGDVLAEAGISSRAFYRHFDGKDSLMLALFRRDADAVARSLRATVTAAGTPVAALDAWLDAFLDLFYEPRRAARVAIMASRGARACAWYEAELARVRELNVAPLVDVLRAGHERRDLCSPEPERDAHTVLAIASRVCDPSSERRFSDRAEARAHVVRFCWPALGLAAATSTQESIRPPRGAARRRDQKQ